MSASEVESQASGPYLQAPRLEDLAPEVRGELEKLASTRGYLPEARLVLARRPEVLHALNLLDEAVMRAGTVDPVLKLLVAQMSSTAAGCRHCQAQTAFGAHRRGAADEKIARLWEYETSPLFSAAERAALDLARAASMSPSAARAEHFDRLREHFDEDEIVEIMAVVCLFGWNNRWNDSVATSTPPATVEYATSVLAPSGWRPGKHAGHAAPDEGRPS